MRNLLSSWHTLRLLAMPWLGLIVGGAVACGQVKPGTSDLPAIDTRRGDAMFAAYFAAETEKLSGQVLDEITTAEDWNGKKDELRRQLHEMLGLDPLPERTPLNPVVTGVLDHEQFTVEKLHFQSSPQLYVTGNLYVPKGITKPVPAILYVCGHGNVKKDGVSYGSKTVYQHHGAWLARHGFVCLIVDTLQLGEIEGLHHGTYNHGMYWWWSRGYTPAGVETWNGIRALDYLQSRKEVDPEKLGVTGRSGGGAISWYIAACDERIKAAVPTAGITDLRNHVIDGTVEGHCDCMFMINTYRWDYGTLAALVAPRPLLISNTDDDRIFPLDGVERIHWQTKKIYGLLGAAKKLGLQISWGGHYDTQELQVAAFRWFNMHLKGEDPKIEVAALKLFQPEQLKVFDKLPADQRNTTAHEWFVPRAAKPQVPSNSAEWATLRDGWMKQLREKSFRGWPKANIELDVEERRLRLRAKPTEWSELLLTYSAGVPIQLTTVGIGFREGSVPERIVLRIGLPTGDDYAHAKIRPNGSATVDSVLFAITPRGLSDTAWDQTPKKQTQHRRRLMLLGQTLESEQVWDVRQAIQAVHSVPELKDVPVTLAADGGMAGIALYAALFEPSVARLELANLPTSHMPSGDDPNSFGPPMLNVLRYLDMPQAVAMAAERATVVIETEEPAAWEYPVAVAKSLGWKGRVEIKAPTK
jgi:dienelactone hydrolase